MQIEKLKFLQQQMDAQLAQGDTTVETSKSSGPGAPPAPARPQRTPTPAPTRSN